MKLGLTRVATCADEARLLTSAEIEHQRQACTHGTDTTWGNYRYNRNLKSLLSRSGPT